MFKVPFEEQYKYLSSLGEPRTDKERSYFQFKCQFYFVQTWKILMLDCIALFMLVPTLLVLYIFGIKPNRKSRKEAIGDFGGFEEVLPLSLTQELDIHNEAWTNRFSLQLTDFIFLIKNTFGWLHPYFTLKMVLKVANYSYMIQTYNPKYFVVHEEFSFTSSIMTSYCNSHGIKHIDVMHGDKLNCIRDSFFRFDKCYVWDKHYEQMLINLKADPSQFIIEIPPSLKIDVNEYQDERSICDFKYYLTQFTEDEMRLIAKCMNRLNDAGYSVKVRPHPRYSELSIIKKYLDESYIELPQEVNIMTSLSNTKCAIGMYTTTLLQAYFSGIEIMLDDVTYKHEYQLQKDLGYILANVDTKKLSDMVKDIN